jgi:hypothetical protein
MPTIARMLVVAGCIAWLGAPRVGAVADDSDNAFVVEFVGKINNTKIADRFPADA